MTHNETMYIKGKTSSRKTPKKIPNNIGRQLTQERNDPHLPLFFIPLVNIVAVQLAVSLSSASSFRQCGEK